MNVFWIYISGIERRFQESSYICHSRWLHVFQVHAYTHDGVEFLIHTQVNYSVFAFQTSYLKKKKIGFQKGETEGSGSKIWIEVWWVYE